MYVCRRMLRLLVSVSSMYELSYFSEISIYEYIMISFPVLLIDKYWFFCPYFYVRESRWSRFNLCKLNSMYGRLDDPIFVFVQNHFMQWPWYRLFTDFLHVITLLILISLQPGFLFFECWKCVDSDTPLQLILD